MNMLDWINQGIDNLTNSPAQAWTPLVSGSSWHCSQP